MLSMPKKHVSANNETAKRPDCPAIWLLIPLLCCWFWPYHTGFSDRIIRVALVPYKYIVLNR